VALTPPTNRLWWNEPIPKVELVWIIVGFAWGLVMFFMMIYWHAVGEQNLSNEAYRTTPEAFTAKAQDMVAQHQVRTESGFPVVRPPPGSDLYLIGRLWQWWPIFELERGQSYRLHTASTDWQHGLSIQPINVNVQVHPGYELVMTITPDQAGEYALVCNEFCGIGHHTMLGKMYVVEP
jgi:cytochrome c oxidase subunit 2